MLGVDFYLPCNLFYFRSSTVLVESPSTTELNNFFSLFWTTSSRRLSVLDYGEFPNVNKNFRCCVVGFRSLKSSHGNRRVQYFKEFEINKKINFSMNYYLNVSLIGSSNKKDRCQNVTSLYLEIKIPCLVPIFQVKILTLSLTIEKEKYFLTHILLTSCSLFDYYRWAFKHQ